MIKAESGVATKTKGFKALEMMMFVNGSAELYLGLLKDMFNMVLIHQDEIGMSDSNALGSLQLIAMLHKDIRDIVSDDCLAQMLGIDEEHRCWNAEVKDESVIESIFPDL